MKNTPFSVAPAASNALMALTKVWLRHPRFTEERVEAALVGQSAVATSVC
jgi:hypothetical protein